MDIFNLNETLHYQARCSQRGISKEMIETALIYGKINPRGDRVSLNRKRILKEIEIINKKLKLNENNIAELTENKMKLLKVLDKKKCLTLVIENNYLITAYDKYYH